MEVQAQWCGIENLRQVKQGGPGPFHFYHVKFTGEFKAPLSVCRRLKSSRFTCALVDTKKMSLLRLRKCQHQRSHIKQSKCDFQSCHITLKKFQHHFLINDSFCDKIDNNYFMHQIFSESPGQLKILCYILEECPCQVLDHSNIVWPNFNLFAMKQVLIAITMLETLFPKIEHTVGPKIPLRVLYQISVYSNIVWPRRQKSRSSYCKHVLFVTGSLDLWIPTCGKKYENPLFFLCMRKNRCPDHFFSFSSRMEDSAYLYIKRKPDYYVRMG